MYSVKNGISNVVNRYTKTSRPYSSLLLGLAILFFLGSLLYTFGFANPDVTSVKAVAEEPIIADPFERGEYYFNADDDPSGPYDLAQARSAYEEALVGSSTAHATAWYQLGRVDFLEGTFDEALYKFEKQTQYFGDTVPSVHYMVGLTYGYKARENESEEDWDRAAEAFLKFIALKPESPWARTDLSWIYFSQGKYTEMRPVLEEGLQYNPEHPWLHNMYGLALMNTGNKAEAAEHFVRALAGAEALTPHEWGKAYPGNDPASWNEGLASFKEAIKNNLTLVAQ